MNNDRDPDRATRSRWGSLCSHLMHGVAKLLGWFAGFFLVFGAILATMHPIGIVLLSFGILALIGLAVRGVCTWALWTSTRPRWQKVTAGVLAFGPLALSALAVFVAIGYMAITNQWP